MNKLKRGLVGLHYLFTHPRRILYLGWLEKKHGKVIADENIFRHQHDNVCISFEGFLKKMHLSSLINFKTQKEEGSISPYETFVLCSLIKAANLKTIFEIGTFNGRTTNNIAKNLPKNGRIYTLDINQLMSRSEKIIPLSGDSLTFDFSQYHDKFYLMFIDGKHEYEYVLSDSKNALKCVKNGGFIVWHDFDHLHMHSTHAILKFCDLHNLKISWIEGTKLALCKIDKKHERKWNESKLCSKPNVWMKK